MRVLLVLALTGALATWSVVPAGAAPVRSLSATRVVPYAAQADGRFVRLPTDAAPTNGTFGSPTTGTIRDDATGELTVPAPGCVFTAPSSGYVGERCGDGVWRALDLRTGSRAVIDRGPRSVQPGVITEVGSQWAFFNGPLADYYVNWRTGAQVGAPGGTPHDRTVDLNRATAQPRATLVQGTVVQGIDSADLISRPIDSADLFSPPRDLPAGAKPLKALRLRVGRTVRTIRSRCATVGCFSIQYANGILTWIENPLVRAEGADASSAVTINAYVTATRRSYRARVPDSAGIPTLVTHTARRIYAYAGPQYPSGQTSGGWKVTLPQP